MNKSIAVACDVTDSVKDNIVLFAGDHSKMSLDTKNIFIECTGTDVHKVRVSWINILRKFYVQS